MSRTREVSTIVDEIRPCLGGAAPEIAGAVLADLLATWLAAHLMLDDDSGEIRRAETNQMRASILAAHIGSVTELIMVNEAEILGNLKAGRS